MLAKNTIGLPMSDRKQHRCISSMSKNIVGLPNSDINVIDTPKSDENIIVLSNSDKICNRCTKSD